MEEQKLIETRLPVVWATFHTLFNYPFSKMFDTPYCILAETFTVFNFYLIIIESYYYIIFQNRKKLLPKIISDTCGAFTVCNFQSTNSPVELNSLLSNFFCYITWFVISSD